MITGMGSQWAAMAKALMVLDVFAESIEKCHKILEKYNIDLKYLLLSEDDKALDTTVAPFVAIAAVQIGLVNILKKLNVHPDGIVGHSVGELGCAYADGCFDAEQMLMAAYWRGKCVEDAHLPSGLMAAVGLSWEDAKRRCPNGVVPACHNAEDSVTISGEFDATKKFLEELRAENTFAREVKSCGVAFHSSFMNPIAPTLLSKLKQILPKPIERSPKWVSSSVPEARWGEELCKYSAPQYYVNNLVSPVLFQEALQHVPKNAICIEIAPHCLLQAILKRSLGAEMSYVGLMKRGNNAGNLDFLLSAIGKMYNLGLNPEIEKLYPAVQYPVPRGTPSISPLIKWDHSQSWLVTQYPEYFNPSSSSDYVVKVDLNESEDEYLAGHTIDGRVLYPATAYLMLAWKMLAKMKGQFYDKIPVEFENVTLHRATILPKQGQVKFVIRMMESSGEFSISEGGTVAVTGRIFVPEDPVLNLQHLLDDNSVELEDDLKLIDKDIYKELRVRGYDYGGLFKGLTEATADGRSGKIKWTNNWVSFADAMLQIGILGKKTRGLFLPVRFQSVRFDPRVMAEALEEVGEEGQLAVVNDPRINVCVAKGVEIRGLKVNLAPRRQGAQIPTVEKYQFIPYEEDCALETYEKANIDEYVAVCSSLAKKVLEASGAKASEIKQLFKDYKEVDESVLKRYITAPAPEHALVQVLKELITVDKKIGLTEAFKKIFSKYGENLAKDLLANVYLKERFLRSTLDVVMENLNSKKLSIVEVNSSNEIVHPVVTGFLQSSEMSVKIEYTLVHPSPTDLPIELTAAEMRMAEWNVAKSKVPLESTNMDLVVYKDVLSTANPSENVNLEILLDSIYGITKDNGFAIALLRNQLTPAEEFLYRIGGLPSPNKREEQFLAAANKIGFSVISNKSDSMTCSVILLRKTNNAKSSNAQSVIMVDNHKYDQWVDAVKAKLDEHQNKQIGENIWLVAKDTPANGVVGMVNCLRQEPGGDKLRCIFDTRKSNKISFDQRDFADILQKDLVMNIFNDGKFGSYRHLLLDNSREEEYIETEHAYLNVATRGDLSSLDWYEAQHKFWPTLPATHRNPNEVLCSVYYAPLNFRDIMLATGKLPPDALPGDMALQDCILGLEFAGRDQRGNRVMGMVPAKGLATTVVVDDPDFLWKIPDSWTMEEASTVPVVYGTAYYALCVRGGLEEGESVLIHSGSGGVGQAAISIALSMGCEVYTTVGSSEKREFLKKEFPQLKDNNFANSRDTSFEQHILRQTKGRGVDVVLNSLSEEKLQASVRCLAQHGRFLEIGKYDLSQNNPLGKF